jgi:hypothetical protein
MKKSLFLSVSILTILSTTAFAAKPPGHGSSSQGMMSAPAATPTEDLSGKVLETMNSGGYTYVHLQKKNSDKVWVAIPESPVKVGAQISLQPGMEMIKFESRNLNRTFDSIIFSGGVIATPGSSAASSAIRKDQESSPGSKGATAAKEGKISVAKATGPNATTVEAAHGNSAKLDKKMVVIKGKVVKVSTGIMGKNWVHIQDGTGTEAKGTHNIVCTSNEMATVGDVITVSGMLAKDRDFGSGYRYDAIIENATFKK